MPFPIDLPTGPAAPPRLRLPRRAPAPDRGQRCGPRATGRELTCSGPGSWPLTFPDRMIGLQTPGPAALRGVRRPAGQAERLPRHVAACRLVACSTSWPTTPIAMRATRPPSAMRSGKLLSHGKPVAMTEFFGRCPYAGAAAKGGPAGPSSTRAADPPRLDGDYTRDEGEQVRYFEELTQVPRRRRRPRVCTCSPPITPCATPTTLAPRPRPGQLRVVSMFWWSAPDQGWADQAPRPRHPGQGQRQHQRVAGASRGTAPSFGLMSLIFPNGCVAPPSRARKPGDGFCPVSAKVARPGSMPARTWPNIAR